MGCVQAVITITSTQVSHPKPPTTRQLEGIKKNQHFLFFMSPETRDMFMQRYIQFPKQIPNFTRKSIDEVWEKSPAVLPVVTGQKTVVIMPHLPHIMPHHATVLRLKIPFAGASGSGKTWFLLHLLKESEYGIYLNAADLLEGGSRDCRARKRRRGKYWWLPSNKRCLPRSSAKRL